MSNRKTNIASLFLEKAKVIPSHTAFIDKHGRKISYKDLSEQVGHYAAYLKEKGIKKGDRVMILVPVSIELYKVFLAVIYSGAVAVFIDQWAGLKRMRESARIAGCKAFIAPFRYRLLVSLLNIKAGKALQIKASADQTVDLSDTEASDPAIITFSTGTTGKPKAAIRTHGILAAQFAALSDIIDARRGESDCSNLPVIFLLNLAAGKTSVLPARLKEPGYEVLKQIRKNHVSTISCSPAFALKLAQLGGSHLKKVFIGGASVFPDDIRQLKKAWPEARVTVVYGSTEAEPIASAYGKEVIRYEGEGLFAGWIHPLISLRLLPEFDSENPAPGTLTDKEFTVGEICVAGEHVVGAYLMNEETSSIKIMDSDGILWHRTGDLGYLNDKGNLFLLGRKHMIFNGNGKTYYPIAVEKCARQFAGLGYCAFLAKGDICYLFIENNTIDRDILKGFMEGRGYHLEVVRVARIPRDKRHNSRPDYERLKSLF